MLSVVWDETVIMNDQATLPYFKAFSPIYLEVLRETYEF
jgi:hypothetical protein